MAEVKSDYTSAATMPVKLFHNPVVQDGKVVPYHATIVPTNVCNSKCKECFCDGRDQTKVMDYSDYIDAVDELYDLGTRALSFSGGGEPACHPQINEMIDYAKRQDMDVALVSNSINLDKLDTKTLDMLTWLRVSATTSHPMNIDRLRKAVDRTKNVDWGISYIVGDDDDYKNLADVIEYANKEDKITHVRVVSNMKSPQQNNLAKAKTNIHWLNNIDDSKVVWQTRTDNPRGTKNCLVSLLHPVIDVDGNVQPCCGIHFSTTPPKYDFVPETAVCHIDDYHKVIENQDAYDGSSCDICQYDDINKTLEMLIKEPEHKRFV